MHCMSTVSAMNFGLWNSLPCALGPVLHSVFDSVLEAMADSKDARGARLGSAQLAEITPSEPDHGHACVGKHPGVVVMQGRCHTCQIT